MKQYNVDAFTDEVFRGNQTSKRGGELTCELRDNRVIISGRAAIFAVSELMI